MQRNAGGDAGSIEDRVKRGAVYMWLTLQTHRVMKEYIQARFREHTSIAPMLNIHLFKNMVPVEKFDAMKVAQKVRETQVKEAKSLAEKAMSAAHAAKGQNQRKDKA